MSNLQLVVNEIKSNKVINEIDVWEMSFYIRQSYEFFNMMVVDGYLASEEKFQSADQSYLNTICFERYNIEHLAYANTSLGRNLQMIRQIVIANDPKSFILNKEAISDGSLNGGMNDFLQETLIPCIPVQFLVSSSSIDIGIDIDALHRLLIHFFAVIKLHFGSLDLAPDSSFMHDQIATLGVDPTFFSFREMTLLAGYKTERAVRNLASPSTPDNRRISIVKKGRLTVIKHKEAVRWLLAQSNKIERSVIEANANA
jgi:hypothetical protein